MKVIFIQSVATARIAKVPIINGLGKLLFTFKREISIALQITQ